MNQIESVDRQIIVLLVKNIFIEYVLMLLNNYFTDIIVLFQNLKFCCTMYMHLNNMVTYMYH